MAERFRAILFEDQPVNAMVAKLLLPKYGIDVDGHASSLDEGLELAERAKELEVDGALVDQDLGSAGSRLSDGARIIRRLKARRPSGLIIVEFSGTVKKRGGIIVPRFGGHYAVLKGEGGNGIKEAADFIKAGHQ